MTLISDYLETIKLEGKSPSSIKNYKVDIKQFLEWRDRFVPLDTLPESYKSYQDYLKANYSGGSVKRKLSAIRGFLAFCLPPESAPPAKFRLGRSALPFASLGVSLATLLLLVPIFTSGHDSETVSSSSIPEKVVINSQVAENKYLSKARGVEIVVSAPTISKEVEYIEDEIAISKLSIETSSSGRGKILKGQSAVVISSAAIKKDSLIFLTPTSETSQVLFISHQENGSFVVSVKNESENDVNFNWFVDNTEIA